MEPNGEKPDHANISIPEMRDALLRSGYLVETQLAAVLRNKRFRVEANAPYPDPETGKQREFDLLASCRQAFAFGPRKNDWISPVLVIECVNTPVPITLFTGDWPVDSSDSSERWEALKIAGHPLQGPKDDIFSNWSWIAPHLQLQEFHHYAKGSIATQFCFYEQKEASRHNGSKSKERNSQEKEWMALHPNERWVNLKVLMAAMIYHMGKCYDDLPEQDSSIKLEIFYPILVLKGKIYEAKLDEKEEDGFRVEESSHLQYRYSLIRGPRQEDFQIDIVGFSYFPDFVDMILQESSALAKRMQQNYKKIQEIVSARRRAMRRNSSRSVLAPGS